MGSPVIHQNAGFANYAGTEDRRLDNLLNDVQKEAFDAYMARPENARKVADFASVRAQVEPYHASGFQPRPEFSSPQSPGERAAERTKNIATMEAALRGEAPIGGFEASGKYWSGDVNVKVHPPKGLFAKGTADDILAWLQKSHGSLQTAMDSLNFYVNRAGKNLSKERRAVLEQVKQTIQGEEVEQGAAASAFFAAGPHPKLNAWQRKELGIGAAGKFDHRRIVSSAHGQKLERGVCAATTEMGVFHNELQDLIRTHGEREGRWIYADRMAERARRARRAAVAAEPSEERAEFEERYASARRPSLPPPGYEPQAEARRDAMRAEREEMGYPWEEGPEAAGEYDEPIDIDEPEPSTPPGRPIALPEPGELSEPRNPTPPHRVRAALQRPRTRPREEDIEVIDEESNIPDIRGEVPMETPTPAPRRRRAANAEVDYQTHIRRQREAAGRRRLRGG